MSGRPNRDGLSVHVFPQVTLTEPLKRPLLDDLLLQAWRDVSLADLRDLANERIRGRGSFAVFQAGIATRRRVLALREGQG